MKAFIVSLFWRVPLPQDSTRKFSTWKVFWSAHFRFYSINLKEKKFKSPNHLHFFNPRLKLCQCITPRQPQLKISAHYYYNQIFNKIKTVLSKTRSRLLPATNFNIKIYNKYKLIKWFTKEGITASFTLTEFRHKKMKIQIVYFKPRRQISRYTGNFVIMACFCPCTQPLFPQLILHLSLTLWPRGGDPNITQEVTNLQPVRNLHSEKTEYKKS